MKAFQKTEFVIATEIISPYRIPVFNEIAGSLKDKVYFLFLGETEKRRQWKIYKEDIRFSYGVLPSILFQRQGLSPYFFNPTIFYSLLKQSPGLIIIGGYQHPSYLLVLLYAKLFKSRIILWCESNKYDYRLGKHFIEGYKKWFVKNCSGYIVPGRASFEYIISLGADPKDIWIAPNAVDNDYFNRVCRKYRENRGVIKKAKGYPERIILYIGRLIEQKGILDLLKAFQIFLNKRPELGLLLVGDGREARQYRHFCRANNLNNVFFTGFIQQAELPFYYGLADIFILPSHSEQWGLVLNEAMACGLPVIASDAVGAALDLIVTGENGYIYQNGNIKELVEVTEKVLDSDMEAMGLKSCEIIKNFSPQKCAEGFIKAIKNERKAKLNLKNRG